LDDAMREIGPLLQDVTGSCRVSGTGCEAILLQGVTGE
jgi:hypothetical protein